VDCKERCNKATTIGLIEDSCARVQIGRRLRMPMCYDSSLNPYGLCKDQSRCRIPLRPQSPRK
jgi:hypothetical protein